MSLQASIVKKLIPKRISGWAEGDAEEQRSRQERLTRYMRLPSNVRCQPIDANGVPAEWISGPSPHLGAILYLHGGAYTLGSINTHRELIARLACASDTRGLVINYRLAPEHLFPAALDDAITAYRWLVAQGTAPEQIIIAGDSAGGGLALAT